MKGYVHVYTGNGKGKTTAALGLALRAAGADLKVFFAQFVKGMEYSELKSLTRLDDLITIKQYGRDCFIKNEPTEADIQCAQAGLQEVRALIHSQEYELIILDEATIATYYHLFSDDDLVELMTNRPEQVELVITGRYASQKILDEADLITEMKEVKHYFNRGVAAREGIEK